MNKPVETVEGFYTKMAGYEDDYDRQHASRIDWVVKRFGLDQIAGKRVVDVGAGKGNYFKRMNPDNYFVGLDGAKIQGKLCPFLSLRVDLNQPFAHLFDNEEKFDWLICSETLEHVASIDNVLLEMKKILKENHYAIFTIPCFYLRCNLIRVTRYGSNKGIFSVPETRKTAYTVNVHDLLIVSVLCYHDRGTVCI